MKVMTSDIKHGHNQKSRNKDIADSKAIIKITKNNDNRTRLVEFIEKDCALSKEFHKHEAELKELDGNRKTTLESERLTNYHKETKATIVSNFVAIIDSNLYIVNSGLNNGEISFGIFKKINVSKEDIYVIKEGIENDITRKGKLDIRAIKKYRSGIDSKTGISISGEQGRNLSTSSRQSEDNERGISGDNADRGRGIEFSKTFSSVEASKHYARICAQKLKLMELTKRAENSLLTCGH